MSPNFIGSCFNNNSIYMYIHTNIYTDIYVVYCILIRRESHNNNDQIHFIEKYIHFLPTQQVLNRCISRLLEFHKIKCFLITFFTSLASMIHGKINPAESTIKYDSQYTDYLRYDKFVGIVLFKSKVEKIFLQLTISFRNVT